ncbi:MAG: alpha-galactosidase [Chitinophagales bacterium]|nr:alpha-galactosidase [Chitinophagales bacterium]
MYIVESVFLQYAEDGKSKKVTPKSGSLDFQSDDFSFAISVEETLSGERIKAEIQTKKAIILERLELILSTDYSATKSILINGFQSWSSTGIYSPEDKIKPLKKITRSILDPYGDYTYYEYTGKKGELHSWNYTYYTLPLKKIQFIGSVDEKNAFTNFVHKTQENKLHIIRDVNGWEIQGERTVLDVFQCENLERSAFQHYFMLCEYPEPKVKPSIGWTSWYHYYTKISEEIVLENLNNYQKQALPIDIFQIDDGYQTKVGDWLSVNEKFPSGMKAIAQKIKAAGYKAGIWLAPFIAEKKSELVKNHPDWLLKYENDKPLRVGINPLWSNAFYALDIYHPEVRVYLQKVLKVFTEEWNYDLLKLDFLYAVCLIARNGKTHAQMMSDALDLVRNAIGEEKMTLGCGVPLGSASGKMDFCRVGQDIHLSWEMKPLKWLNHRERLSTYLAINNSINRRQLNGYAFLNDPDVMILRSKKQKLSKEEQFTLLLTNLIFGDLIFTSDNIGDYDEDTMQLYRSIFPLVRQKEIKVEHSGGLYRILFQIDDRRYTAFINTSDQDKLYKLSEGIYFDVRSQEIISRAQTISIPKHQSILYHNCSSGPFGILGTKGHFFAGSEITKIALRGVNIDVSLRENLLIDPIIYLKVPKDYIGETINNQPFELIQKKMFAIAKVQLKAM